MAIRRSRMSDMWTETLCNVLTSTLPVVHMYVCNAEAGLASSDDFFFRFRGGDSRRVIAWKRLDVSRETSLLQSISIGECSQLHDGKAKGPFLMYVHRCSKR